MNSISEAFRIHGRYTSITLDQHFSVALRLPSWTHPRYGIPTFQWHHYAYQNWIWIGILKTKFTAIIWLGTWEGRLHYDWAPWEKAQTGPWLLTYFVSGIDSVPLIICDRSGVHDFHEVFYESERKNIVHPLGKWARMQMDEWQCYRWLSFSRTFYRTGDNSLRQFALMLMTTIFTVTHDHRPTAIMHVIG